MVLRSYFYFSARSCAPRFPPLDTSLVGFPEISFEASWNSVRVWFLAMRHSVPFSFICSLASEFGAVDCFWRESSRSFTGYVAEVWFDQLPSDFAVRWARVVGYSVVVRCPSSGPGRFAVSVPCVVPAGEVSLGWASRGSRVRLSELSLEELFALADEVGSKYQ